MIQRLVLVLPHSLPPRPRRPPHPPPSTPAASPGMLPPLSLPSTLLFTLLAAPAVLAGDVPWLQACNPAHQKLQEGTYQFQTDCDAMTYCAGNSTCALRGCRSDEFPFGYSSNVTIPDKCPRGSFCPDEQDSCQPLLAVGSACQFNRDGESLVAVMCGAVEEIRDRRVVLRMKMNAKDRRTLGNLRTRLGLD